MFRKLIFCISYMFFAFAGTPFSDGFAAEGVFIINKDEAIKHLKGYEKYDELKRIEDEKFDRRIKRETQILTERLEKFKYESAEMAPSAKAAEKDELVKYGNSLKALEVEMKKEKEKVLEREYKKIEKEWSVEIKKFSKAMNAKVVFLPGSDKMIYRAKGVTPLTIRVLKQDKGKRDITGEFIKYADKISGRETEEKD